jgi:hypothetical protein
MVREVRKPEEGFETRLMEEHTSLEIKVNNLTSALNDKKVPESEEVILEKQLDIMVDYLEILELRLQKLNLI